MFGCTTNDASTHHFKTPLPFALRMSGNVSVPQIYFMRCVNLDQLSVSGSRTCVVKNATEVHVSGLALLVAYRVFATRL